MLDQSWGFAMGWNCVFQLRISGPGSSFEIPFEQVKLILIYQTTYPLSKNILPQDIEKRSSKNKRNRRVTEKRPLVVLQQGK